MLPIIFRLSLKLESEKTQGKVEKKLKKRRFGFRKKKLAPILIPKFDLGFGRTLLLTFKYSATLLVINFKDYY